jgi:hypothetical protein
MIVKWHTSMRYTDKGLKNTGNGKRMLDGMGKMRYSEHVANFAATLIFDYMSNKRVGM